MTGLAPHAWRGATRAGRASLAFASSLKDTANRTHRRAGEIGQAVVGSDPSPAWGGGGGGGGGDEAWGSGRDRWDDGGGGENWDHRDDGWAAGGRGDQWSAGGDQWSGGGDQWGYGRSTRSARAIGWPEPLRAPADDPQLLPIAVRGYVPEVPGNSAYMHLREALAQHLAQDPGGDKTSAARELLRDRGNHLITHPDPYRAPRITLLARPKEERHDNYFDIQDLNERETPQHVPSLYSRHFEANYGEGGGARPSHGRPFAS